MPQELVWRHLNIKYENLVICGTPPPTLGDFSTIPKIPNGKTISCPTKFLQSIHMDIGYGDCVALGGH